MHDHGDQIVIYQKANLYIIIHYYYYYFGRSVAFGIYQQPSDALDLQCNCVHVHNQLYEMTECEL